MKYLIGLVVLSAIILPAEFVIPLSIIAMIIYATIDKSLLKIFRRKSVYFLFTIVVILQPMIIGEQNNQLFGITFSTEALLNGLGMFCRAIIIISSITLLNRTTDRENIKAFWKRRGLEEFDNVLHKAEEILPNIKSEFNKVRKENTSIRTLLKNPAELTAKMIYPLLHKSENLIANNRFNEEIK
ncbi:hypothetical protein ASZ90_003334 [hydrocarbon metagenome]|uniref:Uncharacterized protein n=1 Tax=hydrocarbon metagenome TaxID=938273 RepID=A0A0W8G1B6_9ZZZZ